MCASTGDRDGFRFAAEDRRPRMKKEDQERNPRKKEVQERKKAKNESTERRKKIVGGGDENQQKYKTAEKS